MSDTPWTSGPWKVDGSAVKVQQGTIARIPQVQDGGVFGRVQNARLIAAAPEMAELLATWGALFTDEAPICAKTRALLSRIRGEA